MHVDYKGQARMKEQSLKEALRKYAGYTGPILPILKNPNVLGYRNACKLPFGTNEEGRLITGMYGKGGQDFVPVPRCLIHSKKLERVRQELAEIFNKYDLKPYSKKNGEGLMSLVLKEYDGQVHVIVVSSEMELPEELVNEILEAENVASLWQSIKTEEDKDFELFGSKMIHLGGTMDMSLNLKDIQLRLLPRSFFQLNTAQAANLYQLVADWIPEGNNLLVEAYCGVGAISLFAADKAKEIIGIEAIPDAVVNAEENALANGKDNIKFICGDAADELKKITKSRKVDTLVVDPPRSGLNQEMRHAILQALPKTIIYVSCNPSTLAKDIHDLEERYRIEKVQPVDMFSQTPHVETVVLLSRK